MGMDGYVALATIVAMAVLVLASVRSGALSDERALRAMGCTCEYPRDGQHVGTCPLVRR